MNREQIIAAANLAAKANDIDPARFVALLQHESANFSPKVLAHEQKSSTGAFGIGQFMPATGAEYGLKAGVPDISKEIAASAAYMAKLKRQFSGDENLATKAYNWGPGNVRKWLAGKATLPDETKTHSARIEGLLGKAATAIAKAPTLSPATAGVAAPMPAAGAPVAATPRFSTSLANVIEAQDVATGQPVADAPGVTPTNWQQRLADLAMIADGDKTRNETLSAMFSDAPMQATIDPVNLPSSVLSALNGIIDKV
jgi:hypothetical protein